MGLLMIARISDNNGEVIGIRLIDDSCYIIKDVPINSLIAGISKGIKVDNLGIANGKLVGTNGSYEKYPLINSSNVYLNHAIVILGKSKDGSTFKIARASGEVQDMPVQNLIAYIEKFGIANGKLVEQNGVKHISSINGVYKEMEVSKRYILARYAYEDRKTKINRGIYLPASFSLMVYDILTGREVRLTELERETGSRLKLYVSNNRYECNIENFYSIMSKAVIHFNNDSGMDYGLRNSVYSKNCLIVIRRSRVASKEVMYDCYSVKDRRNLRISLPRLMASYKINSDNMLMDVKLDGNKLYVRCGTGVNEYNYSAIKDAIEESIKDITSYQRRASLLGGNIFEVDNMGYADKISESCDIRDIVIGGGIKGLRPGVFRGVYLDKLTILDTPLDVSKLYYLKSKQVVCMNNDVLKVIGKEVAKNRLGICIDSITINQRADTTSIARLMLYIKEVKVDGGLSDDKVHRVVDDVLRVSGLKALCNNIKQFNVVYTGENRTVIQFGKDRRYRFSDTKGILMADALLDVELLTELSINDIGVGRYDCGSGIKLINSYGNSNVNIDKKSLIKYEFKGYAAYESKGIDDCISTAIKNLMNGCSSAYAQSEVSRLDTIWKEVNCRATEVYNDITLIDTGETRSISFLMDNISMVIDNISYLLRRIRYVIKSSERDMYTSTTNVSRELLEWLNGSSYHYRTTDECQVQAKCINGILSYRKYKDVAGNEVFIREYVDIHNVYAEQIINEDNIDRVSNIFKDRINRNISQDEAMDGLTLYYKHNKKKLSDEIKGNKECSAFIDCSGLEQGLPGVIYRNRASGKDNTLYDYISGLFQV